MPTLSIVRREFLIGAKWIGIALGILIGAFLLVKIAFFVKELIFPTPPAKPTVAFGKLPPIFFSEGINKDFSYTVDTLSGDLPAFGISNKVYKMEFPGRDILAVERASSRVQELGFDPKPQQISDSLYRWSAPVSDRNTLGKNIILNVRSNEFTLSSAFTTDPGALSGQNLPTESGAIDTATNFLTTLSVLPDDIDDTKTKTQLLHLSNGVILPATSISNTNLITVYFFQRDKDQLPFVYPSGTGSSMNLTVSGGASSGQIIDGRFYYQKISNSSATYPIKTAEEALTQLKQKKAFIAHYDGQTNQILIKNVYLAYYMPGREQKYLMPVIVFEGNDSFFAYVSAIKDEWVGN